jgi:hypothetical protein
MRHTSTPKLSSLGTDLGGAGLSSFDTADTLLFLGGIVYCDIVFESEGNVVREGAGMRLRGGFRGGWWV